MLRFSSCMSPNMEATCREIARLAAASLGTPTLFVGDIPWQEREQQFGRGKIDILWICGLPYIWNWQDEPEAVTLLAAPVMRGEGYAGRPVYYSEIVVRRDSGHASFSDLRGQRFVYNEPRSHSGYNVVRYHLASLGAQAGYFSFAQPSGAHVDSLAWIVDGRADAAAIDSTVFELELDRSPELADVLTSIGSLGPSPMPPWIARGELDPGLLSRLQRFLLSIHEDEAGRAVLDACRIDRFVAVEDNHYDPIRTMAEAARHVRL